MSSSPKDPSQLRLVLVLPLAMHAGSPSENATSLPMSAKAPRQKTCRQAVTSVYEGLWPQQQTSACSLPYVSLHGNTRHGVGLHWHKAPA